MSPKECLDRIKHMLTDEEETCLRSAIFGGHFMNCTCRWDSNRMQQDSRCVIRWESQ